MRFSCFFIVGHGYAAVTAAAAAVATEEDCPAAAFNACNIFQNCFLSKIKSIKIGKKDENRHTKLLLKKILNTLDRFLEHYFGSDLLVCHRPLVWPLSCNRK